MPTVVPVKFAYAARDLWFNPGDVDPREGDHVICDTARGTEIGLVTRDPFTVPVEELGDTAEERELKDVLRVADEADLERAEQLAQEGEAAMKSFRRLVDASGLDMKPVGVEYLFGGEKVVCYFSAEERVDFRQLVRDISSELNERVDMRQIGVREEAAVVGGFAHCGQELCCARFGQQFEPVSIRMAKEQDLPLNSTKISGVCGRLMCCLRYEFEAYRDFKNRAPKKNAVIQTPLGTAKIVEYDTPKEMLSLRLESGKTMKVALADMIASEDAIKKAQELNCPCRPDTVERSVLDKLESPEIQMALAELDREMGLVEEEDFSQEDIFVEEPRRRRRRGSKRTGDATQENAGGRQQKAAKSADKPEAVEAEPSRRRRRRHGRGAADAQAGSEGASTQPTQDAAQTQAAEGERTGGSSRRRNRNRRGSGAGRAAQQDRGSQNAEAKVPRAEGEARTQEGGTTRRRRRPGDKGGAGGAATNEGAQGARSRRRRHRGSSEGSQD